MNEWRVVSADIKRHEVGTKVSNHSFVLSRKRRIGVSITQGKVFGEPTFPVGTDSLEPGYLIDGAIKQFTSRP